MSGINSGVGRKRFPIKPQVEGLEARCLLSGSTLLQEGMNALPAGNTGVTVMPPTVGIATKTALAASADKVVTGEPVKLTATVTAEDGSVPSGSVSFYDGNPMSASPLGSNTAPSSILPVRFLGRVYLGADGTATLMVPTEEPIRILSSVMPPVPVGPILGVGAHSLVAVFQPKPIIPTDATVIAPFYKPSQSAPVGVSVIAKTATTVKSYGAATKTHAPTLVAIVNYSGRFIPYVVPPPIQGEIHSATAKLLVNVPLPPPPMPPTDNTNSAGALTLNGTLSATDPNTIIGPVNQPIFPTGTVTFMDGDTVLGTADVKAPGIAVFTPDKPLDLGDHTITAVYGGADFFLGSTSNPITVSVGLAKTITKLTSSAGSVNQGGSVTWTAMVSTAEKDFVTPGGTVAFMDGDQVLAKVALGSEPATLTVKLATGAHKITAVYSGDENCLPSKSEPMPQLVLPPPVEQKIATAITLKKWGPGTRSNPPILTATIVRPDGTIFGQNWPNPTIPGTINSAGAKLTIKVASPTATIGSVGKLPPVGQSGFNTAGTQSGGTLLATADVVRLVPTGSVTFYDNGRVLGTAKLDADGTATLAPRTMMLGGHTITAVYNGDSLFKGAKASPIRATVTLTATKTALAASADSVYQGGSFDLKTTVSTADLDTVTPGGYVAIYDGNRKLATLKLGDIDKVLTLKLTTGVHVLTAVYSGDQNCRGSKSEVLKITVLAPVKSTPPATT